VTHNPVNSSVERLMCEVEFFGRCVLRKVRELFNVVPIPRLTTR